MNELIVNGICYKIFKLEKESDIQIESIAMQNCVYVNRHMFQSKGTLYSIKANGKSKYTLYITFDGKVEVLRKRNLKINTRELNDIVFPLISELNIRLLNKNCFNSRSIFMYEFNEEMNDLFDMYSYIELEIPRYKLGKKRFLIRESIVLKNNIKFNYNRLLYNYCYDKEIYKEKVISMIEEVFLSENAELIEEMMIDSVEYNREELLIFLIDKYIIFYNKQKINYFATFLYWLKTNKRYKIVKNLLQERDSLFDLNRMLFYSIGINEFSDIDSYEEELKLVDFTKINEAFNYNSSLAIYLLKTNRISINLNIMNNLMESVKKNIDADSIILNKYPEIIEVLKKEGSLELIHFYKKFIIDALRVKKPEAKQSYLSDILLIESNYMLSIYKDFDNKRNYFCYFLISRESSLKMRGLELQSYQDLETFYLLTGRLSILKKQIFNVILKKYWYKIPVLILKHNLINTGYIHDYKNIETFNENDEFVCKYCKSVKLIVYNCGCSKSKSIYSDFRKNYSLLSFKNQALSIKNIL